MRCLRSEGTSRKLSKTDYKKMRAASPASQPAQLHSVSLPSLFAPFGPGQLARGKDPADGKTNAQVSVCLSVSLFFPSHSSSLMREGAISRSLRCHGSHLLGEASAWPPCPRTLPRRQIFASSSDMEGTCKRSEKRGRGRGRRIILRSVPANLADAI